MLSSWKGWQSVKFSLLGEEGEELERTPLNGRLQGLFQWVIILGHGSYWAAWAIMGCLFLHLTYFYAGYGIR